MSEVTIEQTFVIAVRQHEAGQLQQAENLYQQILASQPGHVGAMHNLAALAQQKGRDDIAVDLFRQVVALQPDNAMALANFGNSLRATGHLDEAIAICRRAIVLKPDAYKAYGYLGNALTSKCLLTEAIKVFQEAIRLKPDSATHYCNLANALWSSGQLDESIAACRQAIALDPNVCEAYGYLGNALTTKGLLSEAIVAFRQAIRLKPELPAYYCNLANALWSMGQLGEAVAACRQAIALDPKVSQAYHNLGNILLAQGELDESIAAFRQATVLEPEFAAVASSILCVIHFHPAYDKHALAEEHRQWNQRYAEPLKGLIRPHENDRNPDRRLRIGYISPDFREHPVGRFLLPVLEHHDRTNFEVFAYGQILAPDATTRRIRSHVDGWRNILGLSNDQTADLIRQDRIDILVDLTMHMAYNRLLVFAQKPAPVQVTYLAYCSTTGLEAIDYRLSDPYMDPPGEDESIYSERTMRLPETYWCYQPDDTLPEVGPLPAMKRGYITFGSLNNFCKVNDSTLAVWARVLNLVPKSEFLMHAGEGDHRQRVLDRMAQEGIESGRVRFVGRKTLQEYFKLYSQIDIALDTFPYGGGTTTCDALWMGAATVSLAGKTAVGRGGLSILSNVGLTELVADSQDEYVRIAVELAGDLPRLDTLRGSLRSRMKQSPLMDAPRFTRDVEAAYREMWREWCLAVR